MNKDINDSAIKISLNLTSHKRFIKPIHSFSYSNISIILDLRKTLEANSKSILFSINKFNVFSWHHKDHGNGEENLLNWVKNTIKNYGGNFDGKVILHCFPRIFGKVFNPISVYFCYNNCKWNIKHNT